MIVADPPLATSAESYLDDDYSPDTIVTVIYHSLQLQVYAEDYCGTVAVFSSGKRAGLYSSSFSSSVLYGIQAESIVSRGPCFLSTPIPHGIHHVEIRLEDGRRLTLAVKADSASFQSQHPFAMLYPIGHGEQFFIPVGDYTRTPPANAAF
jgi:hypothetical protein